MNPSCASGPRKARATLWRKPFSADLDRRARRQIERELALIEKLELAGYFLIVWDLVRFCRKQNILVQGRGSAANSAVCYSLGITAVDPVGMDLLFERFLSEERGVFGDEEFGWSGKFAERGRFGFSFAKTFATFEKSASRKKVKKPVTLASTMRATHPVWSSRVPS